MSYTPAITIFEGFRFGLEQSFRAGANLINVVFFSKRFFLFIPEQTTESYSRVNCLFMLEETRDWKILRNMFFIVRSLKLFSNVARLFGRCSPSLYNTFRHHPHRILQSLSLVAEPDSYHLPIVS